MDTRLQPQQRTEALAKLYEGKLRLERRNDGSTTFRRTYLKGRILIKSTGERTLAAAPKAATDRYRLWHRDDVDIIVVHETTARNA